MQPASWPLCDPSLFVLAVNTRAHCARTRGVALAEHDPLAWSVARALLPEKDLAKIARFAFLDDATRALAAAVLYRLAVTLATGTPLREVVIGRTAEQKPFWQQSQSQAPSQQSQQSLAFNATHHGAWVMLAAVSRPLPTPAPAAAVTATASATAASGAAGGSAVSVGIDVTALEVPNSHGRPICEYANGAYALDNESESPRDSDVAGSGTDSALVGSLNDTPAESCSMDHGHGHTRRDEVRMSVTEATEKAAAKLVDDLSTTLTREELAVIQQQQHNSTHARCDFAGPSLQPLSNSRSAHASPTPATTAAAARLFAPTLRQSKLALRQYPRPAPGPGAALELFYTLWARKEAVVKAVGLGLTIEPQWVQTQCGAQVQTQSQTRIQTQCGVGVPGVLGSNALTVTNRRDGLDDITISVPVPVAVLVAVPGLLLPEARQCLQGGNIIVSNAGESRISNGNSRVTNSAAGDATLTCIGGSIVSLPISSKASCQSSMHSSALANSDPLSSSMLLLHGNSCVWRVDASHVAALTVLDPPPHIEEAGAQQSGDCSALGRGDFRARAMKALWCAGVLSCQQQSARQQDQISSWHTTGAPARAECEYDISSQTAVDSAGA